MSRCFLILCFLFAHFISTYSQEEFLDNKAGFTSYYNYTIINSVSGHSAVIGFTSPAGLNATYAYDNVEGIEASNISLSFFSHSKRKSNYLRMHCGLSAAFLEQYTVSGIQIGGAYVFNMNRSFSRSINFSVGEFLVFEKEALDTSLDLIAGLKYNQAFFSHKMIYPFLSVGCSLSDEAFVSDDFFTKFQMPHLSDITYFFAVGLNVSVTK